jgi:hypothetical protein
LAEAVRVIAGAEDFGEPASLIEVGCEWADLG